jgi:hypothetical protein
MTTTTEPTTGPTGHDVADAITRGEAADTATPTTTGTALAARASQDHPANDDAPLDPALDVTTPVPLTLETGGAAILVSPECPYVSPAQVPFSPEINEVLTAPIDDDDVEIRPDGILYFPEIKYRRVLNKAFGAGGWALLPLTLQFDAKENQLFYRGALLAHGRFVAEAIGEAEYFPGNRGMSWATAAESAKSTCLMRCCKDLLIASELWDKPWIRRWKRDNASQVWVRGIGTKNRDEKSVQWRRYDDDPIGYPWEETGFKERARRDGQDGGRDERARHWRTGEAFASQAGEAPDAGMLGGWTGGGGTGGGGSGRSEAAGVPAGRAASASGAKSGGGPSTGKGEADSSPEGNAARFGDPIQTDRAKSREKGVYPARPWHPDVTRAMWQAAAQTIERKNGGPVAPSVAQRLHKAVAEVLVTLVDPIDPDRTIPRLLTWAFGPGVTSIVKLTAAQCETLLAWGKSEHAITEGKAIEQLVTTE